MKLDDYIFYLLFNENVNTEIINHEFNHYHQLACAICLFK